MSIREQQLSSSNLDSAVANNNQPQDYFNLGAADHPNQVFLDEGIFHLQLLYQCIMNPFEKKLDSSLLLPDVNRYFAEENPQDIVLADPPHNKLAKVGRQGSGKSKKKGASSVSKNAIRDQQQTSGEGTGHRYNL
ncbi:hypothetical protein GOBAR_AA22035 [Gossypium barbadense]|uniref:Uncharacterized protein n=1 Tax=Gossypium barbadense TaxID=3634 RepID=A0A2P5X5M7_GOSBA|nr:hypothetical protein GOBAR_AA22035 [Gossypium barbadense]